MAPTQHEVRDASRTPLRSWGESQIGRLLDRNGVSYLYEHPLAVVDDQNKTRIWYPDFQLRGYGILIEYCGRLHDPAYAIGMARKRDVYEANGLQALMLTRDDLKGNWPVMILDQIERVLIDRVTTFRAARSKPSKVNNRSDCPTVLFSQ